MESAPASRQEREGWEWLGGGGSETAIDKPRLVRIRRMCYQMRALPTTEAGSDGTVRPEKETPVGRFVVRRDHPHAMGGAGECRRLFPGTRTPG